MKKTLILLIISLLVLALTPKDLDCQPFSERITLGDRYSNRLDESINIMKVAFSTKSNCTDQMQLTYQKMGSKNQFTINPIETNEIDTSTYNSDPDTEKIQYKIYNYFFDIPKSVDFKEGDIGTWIGFNKDNQDEETTKIFTFQVPSLDQNEESEDRIFVYGDYDANVQEKTEQDFKKDNKDTFFGEFTHNYLMDQAEKSPKDRDFDHMLFLGDLAYDINDEDYVRGEKFFKKSSPYYGSIPHMITYGNHESGSSYEELDYKFVNDFFRQVDYEKGKNRDFAYMTKYAQIINFDAKFLWYNEDMNDQNRVLDQLEQQLILAEKYREERPWVIVFNHYPIYFVDEEGYTEQTEYKGVKKYDQFKRAEELLVKYNVDLYISAHVHVYQSYKPVLNAKEASENNYTQEDRSVLYHQPKGIVYIVEGIAGQLHETKIDEFDDRDIMRNQQYGDPGAAIMTIHNKTHLSYDHNVYLYNGVQKDKKSTDKFWVQRSGDYTGYIGDHNDDKNHDGWTIFGIVMGVSAVLVIIAYFVFRHQQNKHINQLEYGTLNDSQLGGTNKKTELQSSRQMDNDEDIETNNN